MPKRIGRAPVEVNINSPQDGHIPVFDLQTRLWNTISTSSLSLGTSSIAINAISASYLSGSTAIVTNFTSSLDISVRGVRVGRGSIPTTTSNITIGSGSLMVVTSSEGFSASANVAIGDLALNATTLGASNVAIGYSALGSYTSSYSTAVGTYALWKSPSGRNSAFGQASLPFLVTGSNNTALGDATMFHLVHGKNNTAVGNVALRDMVEGDDNTAVGSGAIYRFFVSGSRNTVIGFDTAGGIRTGSFNTIIGAAVQGLPNVLNSNIILSDGQGNIRARYSSSIWTLSDSTVGDFTGSLFGTASWALNALTASSAPAYLPLTGGTIDGNVTVNGTASIAFLNVTYESASVIYSSGSNQFGDASDDVQTLYGTVIIPTGSLVVSGSITTTAGVTASLFGTASWADNAISSSNALTASYVLQAVSASFAVSASQALNSVSSSYPIDISGSTMYSPITTANIQFSTTNSIFLGRATGYYATNAHWSYFIGTSAGSNALNAAYSNFIGLLAGSNASSSFESNFFGRQAGRLAIFANNSNFLGSFAGDSAVSASHSNFLGNYAGYRATNAKLSTFIGRSAGNFAAEASQSVFIGDNAGQNSSGSHTSNFIGYNAGAFGSTTIRNISHHSNFIGDYAGYDAAQAYYSNFIGSEVGFQAVSASYSILIGYRVGRNNILAGQGIKSNNIIIGTNITLNEGRQDSINIGGLIFGTGSYSNINTDPYSGSANGRVGINQPLPLFSLDVSGSGRYTNGLQVTSSLIAPSITGSLFGTASWALNAITSSNAISSSQALTASYVNPLNQDVVISGSLSISGSQGSTLFVTNADTLVFTGSIYLSASIFSTGSITVNEITSSLFGTASWAINALTASYVQASAVQGLSLFRISTGSISASLDVSENSLFLINSGSQTYFNVSSSGNAELYSDVFVVRSFTTNKPVFSVSQSVYKFATQSSAPSIPDEVGSLWFTSTDLYVSLN